MNVLLASRPGPVIEPENLMISDQRGSAFGKRVKSSLLGMEGSEAGLLLLGFALNPLYVNPKALEILVYPETAEALTGRDRFFDRKIRSVLLVDGTCPESGFVPEFCSGRRRYVCRAFSLNAQRPKSPDAPVLALLFERRNHIGFDASRVSARFRLTQREQETFKYVMQGLTNKEIANQMNISPNTVKAFLKLIMTKMGVSTRSAIVGKVIAA
jgi:DNA-binding CsgD family transcriptional regulator